MRSDIIKKGIDRAPHRSLLKATGVKDADMNKPFIGICNSYIDLIPGHVHLQEFGRKVKESVRQAGGVPFEFNTIGVDDGIAMGHQGMNYSLPSRELIADCVETVVAAHALDAHGVHSQLRQDRARHAHGSGAPEHSDHIHLRRTHESRGERQRRNHRPDLGI